MKSVNGTIEELCDINSKLREQVDNLIQENGALRNRCWKLAEMGRDMCHGGPWTPARVERMILEIEDKNPIREEE